MAERLAYLYELDTKKEYLFNLLHDLAHAGISLARPHGDQVFRIDSTGNQLQSSGSELQQQLSDERSTRFLMWMGEAQDIYCRIRAFSDVIVADFGLEGCDLAEIRRISSTIRRRFFDGQTRSIGMVVDPVGISEDYDWDHFFLEGQMIDIGNKAADLPAMLGCRKSAMTRILGLPASISVHADGELVLIDNSRCQE